MITKESCPKKSPATASRVIDNEAVIVIPETNEVKVLNEVGSRIWTLCEGKNNIEQIADIIACEYDISYDEALKDIVFFIEELLEKKVIIA